MTATQFQFMAGYPWDELWCCWNWLFLRGWCIFEKLLSSLVKNCNCFLELSKFDVLDARDRSKQSWFDIIEMCASEREPPMAPDEFEKMMLSGVEREAAKPGTGIRFTCGKDLTDVVLPQYSSAFLRLMGSASELDYANLGWTDRDMDTLITALTYAASRSALNNLVKLNLYSNEFSDDAALKLASAIRDPNFKAPKLTSIETRLNAIFSVATRVELEKAMGTRGAQALTGVGPSAPANSTAKAQASCSSGSPASKSVSSDTSCAGPFAQYDVFQEGEAPKGAGMDVLTLRIGNTHHDEQATKGPLGGKGRHHWCVYVEPRWGGTGKGKAMASSANTNAVEWVEFELHETFRQRFRKVVQPTNGRFELRSKGWGAFVIELKVKLVGESRPHAFSHMLWFNDLDCVPERIYHAEIAQCLAACRGK